MFDSYKADVTEGKLAREGGMGDGLRGKEGRLGQIESIPVLMRSHGESPARKQHVILTFKTWFLHVSKEDTELSIACPVLLRREWRGLVQIVEIEEVRWGSEHDVRWRMPGEGWVRRH